MLRILGSEKRLFGHFCQRGRDFLLVVDRRGANIQHVYFDFGLLRRLLRPCRQADKQASNHGCGVSEHRAFYQLHNIQMEPISA